MPETLTVPAGLNDRSLGWLRFMWDKATTEDDWSDQGEPHPWWDRYSEPPMCSFPRFDLAEMGYVLPLMLEATPAWREAYTHILDELARRYVTFWGGIDWNTLIGPDPGVDRYSPEWLMVVPEDLRGRYASPGWTGNGIAPWGLQPDPIGCDGNLFYRGWLNLLLAMRHYVSGQPMQSTPFEVTGYQNRTFTWTHQRMARFISAQMQARPQGPHCENTKIWPFCVSAAGLGLKLYDSLLGTDLNEPFLRWIDFAKTHYMGRTRRGDLDWFALYYDPIEAKAMTLPGPVNAYSAITVLHYLHPQDPQFATELYDMAMRQLGWSNPAVPVRQLADDPQMLSTALWMAREVGDTVTEQRLREYVENRFQPRRFGDDDTRFAFWLGLQQPWPRGQVNATLMMTECASPGAWSRVFTAPQTTIHDEPTLHGVDYPTLGIRAARNDMARQVLSIDTYAATPARRGSPTAVEVSGLPTTAAPTVQLNGHRFEHWTRTVPGSIRLRFDVDDHHVAIGFSPATEQGPHP
jgi:hypothetical protein